MSCMTSCGSCPAWPLSVFREFDDVEVAALAQLKRPCHLSKGDVLFEQGAPVRGMYCNANGLLKVLQKNQNGKVIFSRLVFPSDSAGHRSLFIEARYKGTASVISVLIKPGAIALTVMLRDAYSRATAFVIPIRPDFAEM
mgnify:CR=1 FL=1